MALVVYFKLGLHQMHVKRAFLNGDLKENVYMTQQEDFVIKRQGIFGMSSEEIHLWLEASFKTMVPQVRQYY
jgi:hypothetical protein